MRIHWGVAAGGVACRLPLAVLVVLATAAPIVGQQDALPQGVTTELIAAGKAVFLDQGLCWACHGEDATGARGVGADLTDEEWWHSDGSFDAIVNQILTGVPAEQVRNEHGAMMPPRGGSGITDEQVRAVAAYVWSLRIARVDTARSR